ncbi:hypothetical protein M1446_03530 [Candidatus Dependentiae bacterium]|nr:hypothetical protein [Candidatus Dependentiae bacterium]
MKKKYFLILSMLGYVNLTAMDVIKQMLPEQQLSTTTGPEITTTQPTELDIKFDDEIKGSDIPKVEVTVPNIAQPKIIQCLTEEDEESCDLMDEALDESVRRYDEIEGDGKMQNLERPIV